MLATALNMEHVLVEVVSVNLVGQAKDASNVLSCFQTILQ